MSETLSEWLPCAPCGGEGTVLADPDDDASDALACATCGGVGATNDAALLRRLKSIELPKSGDDVVMSTDSLTRWFETPRSLMWFLLYGETTPSLTGSPSPRVEPVERPVGHPLSRRGNNDGDRR